MKTKEQKDFEAMVKIAQDVLQEASDRKATASHTFSIGDFE